VDISKSPHRRPPSRAKLAGAALILSGLLSGCIGGGQQTASTVTPVMPTTGTTTPPTTPPTTLGRAVTDDDTAPETTSPVEQPDQRVVLLRLGDRGPEVLALQELLRSDGWRVNRNSVFAAATYIAVVKAQQRYGLARTGKVTPLFIDTVTDAVAERQSTTTTISEDTDASFAVPPATTAMLTGRCVVGIVGDSLVDGRAGTYETAIWERTVCSAVIDGLTSRSLYEGWQCWSDTDGVLRLRLVRKPLAGGDCKPGGLTVISQWSKSLRPFDVVVVALGTNDAGIFGPQTRTGHLERAYELTVDSNEQTRMVVVTTAARPGSARAARLNNQNIELRSWCAERPGCSVADWAADPAAMNPASYTDDVHLTLNATAARAAVIARAVARLV
jgi:hypothetical protein